MRKGRIDGRGWASALRAEKAVAYGIYGIVATVIMTIAVVPGQSTAGAIVTAAVIYSVFWPLGGIMIVTARRGVRVSQARGGAPPPPRG